MSCVNSCILNEDGKLNVYVSGHDWDGVDFNLIGALNQSLEIYSPNSVAQTNECLDICKSYTDLFLSCLVTVESRRKFITKQLEALNND